MPVKWIHKPSKWQALKQQEGPDLDASTDPGSSAAEKIPGKTPQHLADARAAEGLATEIDAAVYECVRDLPALETWLAHIYEAGLVAIDTETTSLDPMQAELVGISLATEPGKACYIPIAHKEGQGDLLGWRAHERTSFPAKKCWQHCDLLLKTCPFSRSGRRPQI